MKPQLQPLISACDQDLKAGRIQDAAQRLSTLKGVKIPRTQRVAVARLCRRAGLIAFGLKTLTPVIHPAHVLDQPASAVELMEYAVLLLRNGVVHGALEILNRIDPRELPQAWLYRSYCHFAHWDYAATIPWLKEYIHNESEAYARLVGRVNLAAALVISGAEAEARELLDRNIADMERTDLDRLRANCFELRAELNIRAGRFTPALQDLERASQVFGSQRIHDQMFVRKWQSVISLRQTGETEPLTAVQAEARRRGDWESARDCDFQRLLVMDEPELFNHLYIGTPFAAYRARIERELQRKPMQSVLWIGDSQAACLDLEAGTFAGSDGLETGDSTHRLLLALTRDLYRPQPIGALFSELFPDEHFNVFTSPNRVHQLLKRARSWLEAGNVPVEIRLLGGGYGLHLHESAALRLPLHSPRLERKSLRLLDLCRQLPRHRSFTAAEAGAALGVGRTQAQDLINWAVREGHLLKVGRGRGTRYSRPQATSVPA